jgi:hypothetical protein
MDPVLIPVFGMTFTLLASVIVFGSIIIIKKGRNEVEKLRLQKEIKEIDLRKEELHLSTLLEENKKYDRMIESNISKVE